MKVKELIEQLKKCDGDKEVIIKFALNEDDEIGYVLIPKIIDSLFNDEPIIIYASYEITKDDCNFIGQYDLKELWNKAKEEI